MSLNSAVQLPVVVKYFGAASNLANNVLSLCHAPNSSGKYYFQADICPGFSMQYEARVPNWDLNDFRLGIHSTLQSFYVKTPNRTTLQVVDMNDVPLQVFALNAGHQLSNDVWNSFKIVNTGSNLIATVNDYGYVARVPNWQVARHYWRDGGFTFSGANSSTVTGSNAVRRMYLQSLTTISDPVVCKNSLSAQIVNTAKLGCTELKSRVTDTTVAFSDWNLTSNLYCTSNAVLSNVSTSNWTTKTATCASLVASGNVACNTITCPALGSLAFMSTPSSNFLGPIALRNGNDNTGYVKQQLTFGYSGTDSYRHAIQTRHNDGVEAKQNSIDFKVWKKPQTSAEIGSNLAMSVTAEGVGVFQTFPSQALDVTGNTRVTGGITCATLGVANTTPSYPLDVSGNCRLNGIVGVNTTPSASYSLKVGGDAWVTNQVLCYQASSSVVSTLDATSRTLKLPKGGTIGFPGYPTIEFNHDDTSKEANAGKISYKQFTGQDVLEIVGGGASALDRSVKIFDKLTVGGGNTVLADLENLRVHGDVNVTGCISFKITPPGGAYPDAVLALNSTGASGTGRLQFVNAGHYIACSDNVPSYDNIKNPNGFGHCIYHNSGAHVFTGGPLVVNNKLFFKPGLSTDTGYNTVGNMKFGNQTVNVTSGASHQNVIITHNLNNATHFGFFTAVDTGYNNLDSFVFKTVTQGINADVVRLRRADASSFGSDVVVGFHYMFVVN